MVEQLRGLYNDGRALIDAEVGFQRARIKLAGRQVRNMALLAIVGLILLACAFIALTVGTMIALIVPLGAWGAMAATVAGCLLLAGVSFWLAAGRIAKATALFGDGSQTGDGGATS